MIPGHPDLYGTQNPVRARTALSWATRAPHRHGTQNPVGWI